MFLKIRHAALEKAFTEIRHKRIDLDEKLSNGWISKEEYQKDLTKLIIEGNDIRTKKSEIEEKLDN